MSIAYVEFTYLAAGYVIKAMKTIAETRLIRLNMLIKQFNDSLAELNEAVGLVRTDSSLSQIRNKSAHSKTGKPRTMGDDMARKIENKLNLEIGWMDTPPSYAELNGLSDPKAMMWQVMEDIPVDEWPTAMRLLAALKKPAKNGSEQ